MKTIKEIEPKLLPEYHFDYSLAKPNRFAQQKSLEFTEMPIYLDKDLHDCLEKKCQESQQSLQIVVNHLLRYALIAGEKSGDAGELDRLQLKTNVKYKVGLL